MIKTHLTFSFYISKVWFIITTVPNFRPCFWREVSIFGLPIVDKTARHYSVQKWPRSKECWVGGGCDVIQSRYLNKHHRLIKYAEEECDDHVLSFVVCFLFTLALEKIMPSSCCVVWLDRWLHILLRPNSLYWTGPILNWVMAGNRFENS